MMTISLYPVSFAIMFTVLNGVHGLGLLFMLGRISQTDGILKAEPHDNGHTALGFGYQTRGIICTFTALGILATILITQYAITLFS